MKRLLISACLVLAGLLVIPNVSNAQEIYQYAAKIVHGEYSDIILSHGKYYTAVDIHNPNDTTVRFEKKIAVADTFECTILPLPPGFLDPDCAVEIDARAFQDAMENDPRTAYSDYLIGFLVIESEYELDVMAVYTVTSGKWLCRNTSLEIEHVSPRIIQR